MTSTLATNAVLPSIGQSHFLRADKNGYPLQKQVPKTYQHYTGTGGETIVPDGSDIITVDASALTGNLTLNFTPNRNFIGRHIDLIVFNNYNAGTVIIQSSGTLNTHGGVVASPYSLSTAVIPGAFELDFFKADELFIGTKSGHISGASGPAFISRIVETTSPVNELNNVAWTDIAFETSNPSPYAGDSGIIVGLTTTTTTINVPGNYKVKYSFYHDGDLAIALSQRITLNGVAVAQADTVVGLTGQSLSLECDLALSSGDVIVVQSQNASGNDSGTTAITTNEIDYVHFSIMRLRD